MSSFHSSISMNIMMLQDNLIIQESGRSTKWTYKKIFLDQYLVPLAQYCKKLFTNLQKPPNWNNQSIFKAKSRFARDSKLKFQMQKVNYNFKNWDKLKFGQVVDWKREGKNLFGETWDHKIVHGEQLPPSSVDWWWTAFNADF